MKTAPKGEQYNHILWWKSDALCLPISIPAWLVLSLQPPRASFPASAPAAKKMPLGRLSEGRASLLLPRAEEQDRKQTTRQWRGGCRRARDRTSTILVMFCFPGWVEGWWYSFCRSLSFCMYKIINYIHNMKDRVAEGRKKFTVIQKGQ